LRSFFFTSFSIVDVSLTKSGNVPSHPSFFTISLTLIVGIDWKRVGSRTDEGKNKKLQRQGFYEGIQSGEVAMREERKQTGRGCRGQKCGKTEKERASRKGKGEEHSQETTLCGNGHTRRKIVVEGRRQGR
jgi:hypothetical protein